MSIRVSELAVNIKVDGLPQVEQAARQVDTRFAGIAKSAMASFGGPLSAAALGATALQLVRIADQATIMQQKLQAAVGSGQALATAQADVFRIAQSTGSTLDASAALYARMALSAKQLGVTQAQVATAAQSVADALRLGGATMAESESAALQLSQALNNGRLNGEELQSILSNAPLLAAAIAKEFGVSVGALKQMGEDGQLVADRVFKAILGAAGDFRTQVEGLPSSVEQSLQRVTNSFARMVQSLDREIGATRFLSRFFDSVSASMDAGQGLSVLTGNLIGSALPGSSLAASLLAGASADATYAARRAQMTGGSFASVVPLPIPRPGGGSPPPRPRPAGGASGIRSRVSGLGATRMAAAVSDVQGFVNTGTIAGVDIADTLAGVTETIRAQMDAAGVTIRETFAEGVRDSVVRGFANGIAAAVASGSLSEGFGELTNGLLGGLGRMMIEFGTESLKASVFMEGIVNSLRSLLPGGGVAASLLMIAAGAALVGLGGAAARSFGDGRSGTRGLGSGATGRGTATNPGAIIERGIFGVPGGILADGRDTAGLSSLTARAGSVNAQRVVINAFGPNDPQFQTALRDALRKADRRVS